MIPWTIDSLASDSFVVFSVRSFIWLDLVSCVSAGAAYQYDVRFDFSELIVSLTYKVR